MERLADAMQRALAVLLIILMGGIVAQTFLSALDVNPMATFERTWPVVGKAITLNSLLDLQWHILLIVGLLPTGGLWLRNEHIRVDFLYGNRSPNKRSGIDLIGNLLFAAPFFALILPAATSFANRAFTSGEGSRNGGLNELYLIKSVLPLGLGLLALAVLVETVLLLGKLLRSGS